MPIPIAGVGTLNASGDTTVDSTTQLRYIRVTVYNEDTVSHTFSFKIGTTVIEKETVAAGKTWTFGPHAVASGTNVVINNAEATTTTAPKYAVTGEY